MANAQHVQCPSKAGLGQAVAVRELGGGQRKAYEGVGGQGFGKGERGCSTPLQSTCSFGRRVLVGTANETTVGWHGCPAQQGHKACAGVKRCGDRKGHGACVAAIQPLLLTPAHASFHAMRGLAAGRQRAQHSGCQGMAKPPHARASSERLKGLILCASVSAQDCVLVRLMRTCCLAPMRAVDVRCPVVTLQALRMPSHLCLASCTPSGSARRVWLGPPTRRHTAQHMRELPLC